MDGSRKWMLRRESIVNIHHDKPPFLNKHATILQAIIEPPDAVPAAMEHHKNRTPTCWGIARAV